MIITSLFRVLDFTGEWQRSSFNHGCTVKPPRRYGSLIWDPFVKAWWWLWWSEGYKIVITVRRDHHSIGGRPSRICTLLKLKFSFWSSSQSFLDSSHGALLQAREEFFLNFRAIMKFLNAHVITPKQPNCYLLDDKFQDNFDKRLAKKQWFWRENSNCKQTADNQMTKTASSYQKSKQTAEKVNKQLSK